MPSFFFDRISLTSNSPIIPNLIVCQFDLVSKFALLSCFSALELAYIPYKGAFRAPLSFN